MSDLNFTIPFNPFVPRGPRFRNLTGQRFTKLLVFGIFGIKSHDIRWLCRCDCGTWYIGIGSSLVSGQKKSCGCSNRRYIKPTNEMPEYVAYCHARHRCTNPNNPAFANYGGRGIKFRFASFDEFFTHLGERPDSKHSLDRINNNGHYELGNVRWTTQSVQTANMRVNRHITAQNQTHILYEWGRITHLKVTTIHERLSHGWCEECAVLPIGHRCSHKNTQSISF